MCVTVSLQTEQFIWYFGPEGVPAPLCTPLATPMSGLQRTI